MMSRKGIFLNIGIVMMICILASIIIGRRLLFPCDSNWLFWGIWLFSYVSFPFLLFHLLKVNGIDESRWFWTIIALLFISIYSFHKENDIALKEIKKNGGIVKTAVVYKRYSSVKSSESISIIYEAEGRTVTAKYNCSKEIYESLIVGDTILIVYSLRCPNWNLPYNYFPTPKEIQEVKQGRLYKDGKFLD
jgi:hypothetical protein